jgi:hypothetical protein
MLGFAALNAKLRIVSFFMLGFAALNANLQIGLDQVGWVDEGSPTLFSFVSWVAE